MKLLILGGTQFLGRYLVASAQSRGHEVTLFNRGQTHPELFPELEQLRGNRDGDLRALENRTWDAVADTCGYTSAQVQASARLLANAVKHYTFVSSISVYRDFSQPGMNETAPLAQLPPGMEEAMGDSATYGARKALCEQAAEAAIPGRVLQVRPGMIVGPHDPTGRFLYWVQRVARGGELLAPGNPNALVQLIDVRDLADWIIRMTELRQIGCYNATGPATVLTLGQMLEQCRPVTGNDAILTWVPEPFLLEHHVKPFSDLPFWLPTGTHQGFFAIDCQKALASGLAFRSLPKTIKDTFAWAHAEGVESRLGLELTRELELLTLWKNGHPPENWRNHRDSVSNGGNT